MLKKVLYLFMLSFSVIFLSRCMFESDISVRRSYTVVYVEDPVLFIIPGTYVYYINSKDSDNFFYDGFCWKSWNGIWYRAEVYSGPWTEVDIASVPYDIINLPPSWRDIPDDTPRIGWGEVKVNWQTWHRDRYWETRHWRR